MIGKFRFEHPQGVTICKLNGKKGCGIGVATLAPSDTSSVLMGETIALYKAEKNLIKKNIVKQKEKIKYLQSLKTYLFPYKFYGRQIDWIKFRFDKFIEKENQSLSEWEEALNEVNNALTEYLAQREKNLQKIKAFKERTAAQDVDSENTEKQN